MRLGGKRELVNALPLLSFGCLITINVLRPFLNVPSDGLQCVIVVFPDHTHLRINHAMCIQKINE